MIEEPFEFNIAQAIVRHSRLLHFPVPLQTPFQIVFGIRQIHRFDMLLPPYGATRYYFADMHHSERASRV